MPLKVSLVSADAEIWSGEASIVVARTVIGEIGLMAGHEPVLSVLMPGEVRVFPVGGGQPERWQVEGGFLSFDSNHLTIVVDRGEVRITKTDGSKVIANAQDGFLSMEGDEVTIVAGNAAIIS